jgi:dolichol-phosphate mannosyltransferase
MKKISIIVPVYCNELSLFELNNRLLKLKKKLRDLQINTEIIFVDDGSHDNSFSTLLKIKGNQKFIKIIKLTKNFGVIKAIKAGLSYVRGDAFTILAADLQDPPELIFSMANYWINGDKFIICERLSRVDSLLQKMFAKLYYKIIKKFVIKDFPEGGFDLALMDKIFLPFLINSAKNTYFPLLIYSLGYKPRIIKYKRELRKHGKSTWTFSKRVIAFIDVFLTFSTASIKFISLTGIFISILSILFGCFIIYNGIIGSIKVPGYTTITVLFSFLIGMVIFMLGLIGEYISRIYEEINKRPEFIIEEVKN